jgi:hypothetical protein
MPKSRVKRRAPPETGMPNSEPLTPSMKLPILVIPTTCTRDRATGSGDGMNTEFMGLSATPCPTMGWSTSTWMPCASRCAWGPTPLSISSCGLPSVPADRITSFLAPSRRYTRCCTPSGSVNTTPYATGYGTPSVVPRILQVGTVRQSRVKRAKGYHVRSPCCLKRILETVA